MLIQIKSVLKHIFKIKRLNKVAGECVQSWHPPLSPFFNHMNPELNFILIQLYYETTIHSTFNIKNKKKKKSQLFSLHIQWLNKICYLSETKQAATLKSQ